MAKAQYRIFLNSNNFTNTFEGYIMTDLEKYVIADFGVTTTQDYNQKNIKIKANTKISSCVTLELLSEDPIEMSRNEIDKRLLSYFDFIFKNHFEGKIKYTHFASEAKKIRQQKCVSWDLALLLAHIEDKKVREKVIEDLYFAGMTSLKKEEIHILNKGSQKEKKTLIRKLISKESFEFLKVQTRGRKYISAIASYLTRCS